MKKLVQELKGITIEEYTTPFLFSVDKQTPLSQIIEIMDKEGIRHLPVLEGKKAIGIVSQRDVLVAMAKDAPKELHAEEFMTSNPYKVTSASTLDEVSFMMSQRKIGSALVLDENQELFGIFTTTDALNALIEIVRGEIE